MISQSEYLEYLKGIVSQIEESDIPQEYRPVALQLMAKPYFYAKQESQGTDSKTSEYKKFIAATPKQLSLIKRLGGKVKENMSIGEASEEIERLKGENGYR